MCGQIYSELRTFIEQFVQKTPVSCQKDFSLTCKAMCHDLQGKCTCFLQTLPFFPQLSPISYVSMVDCERQSINQSINQTFRALFIQQSNTKCFCVAIVTIGQTYFTHFISAVERTKICAKHVFGRAFWTTYRFPDNYAYDMDHFKQLSGPK